MSANRVTLTMVRNEARRISKRYGRGAVLGVLTDIYPPLLSLAYLYGEDGNGGYSVVYSGTARECLAYLFGFEESAALAERAERNEEKK